MLLVTLKINCFSWGDVNDSPYPSYIQIIKRINIVNNRGKYIYSLLAFRKCFISYYININLPNTTGPSANKSTYYGDMTADKKISGLSSVPSFPCNLFAGLINRAASSLKVASSHSPSFATVFNQVHESLHPKALRARPLISFHLAERSTKGPANNILCNNLVLFAAPQACIEKLATSRPWTLFLDSCT